VSNQKHPTLTCPYCYSRNTVVAWNGDTNDGTPDYFGCFDCNADMLRLGEVEERLRRDLYGGTHE